MQINYISAAMESGDFADLFAGQKEIPGQQGAKFNRLLMEGLAANGIPVRACTGRPVTRANCQKKFLPASRTVKNEYLTYCYSAVINLPVIKNIWQMCASYLAVWKDAGKGETAVVCDVLNASIALGASLAARHRKIPCIGLVTDLPHLMVTGVKQSHVRMVEKVMANCTGYILLTEAMNDQVNPEGKPYVIIEGLCDGEIRRETEPRQRSGSRKCIYAGLLDARYGVKDMVDGFVMAQAENAQLHIYGSGPYAQELTEVAARNSNVIYHGVVMNHEVVAAEQEAVLLINPRPTHEEFTKYSFPSKNMEYMASGTAVLTTRLPGMPREYWDYVYLADEETAQGFCREFRKLLALPDSQLDEMGRRGRDFVLEKKNNAVQAAKILKLLK